MYKVVKPHGAWNVVTLINTKTDSSLELGRLTAKILTIINESGCLSEPINANDEWCIAIDKATALKLCLLALPTDKPKRNQSKKAASQQSEQSSAGNDVIDAMTIMLKRKNS